MHVTCIVSIEFSCGRLKFIFSLHRNRTTIDLSSVSDRVFEMIFFFHFLEIFICDSTDRWSCNVDLPLLVAKTFSSDEKVSSIVWRVRCWQERWQCQGQCSTPTHMHMTMMRGFSCWISVDQHVQFRLMDLQWTWQQTTDTNPISIPYPNAMSISMDRMCQQQQHQHKWISVECITAIRLGQLKTALYP